MNTGQMLMTLGGLVILTYVFLNINRGFSHSNDVLMNTKLSVLAVSLGTSIIEEASSQSFDEASIETGIYDIGAFTLPAALGPESGEVRATFDDFDDFDGLMIQDTTTIQDLPFNIECNVTYVVAGDPEQVSNGTTWHKKLTVGVSSIYMTDTISVSSVQSYFFFR